MVDVVVNHMGQGDISTFTPFSNDTFYHPYCLIKDYSNQDQVEKCRFAGDLPDIKTEDSMVRKIFNDWVTGLVQTYAFDGLRIDTARHVEKEFYMGFLEAAGNPYAIGEVFQGDPNYIQSASFRDLVNTHNTISQDFKDPRLLGTFIDNHDVPRFMSQTSDTVRLKNALAYVILARGIPIVYYGTEYGYMGKSDPENREDLWRMGYDTSGDVWKFIKTLNTVKLEAGGLGADDHVHLTVQDGVYVFGRLGGKVIVLTRNQGNTGNEKRDYCFVVEGMEERQYKSALTRRTYASGEDGRICVGLESGMPDVLVVL
ncbi:Alpha-amylase [Arthrobotrys entomopaga]|nr:Alpha-amylase [Arthrobotrys entomopaga]